METPLELLAFNRLRRRLWSEVHGARVLEVGVGTGKNLPYHPDGARSVAIDISPRMLRRAASRAQHLGRDVDLVLADAQHLPFRDDTFDSAADTFVFCSVPDPIAGLEEVRRVVRDEGQIHLVEHVRAPQSRDGAIDGPRESYRGASVRGKHQSGHGVQRNEGRDSARQRRIPEPRRCEADSGVGSAAAFGPGGAGDAITGEDRRCGPWVMAWAGGCSGAG